ncbi:hypothetical protein [Clostridium sp.]|uniref:hypothetical protein n=1 Tax=Clostridium sp. TaxID=1506 RepID=UPI003216C7AD
MKIVNESRIDYQYRYSAVSPVVINTIISNKVATTVVNNTLCARKEVDKCHGSMYEILNYRIKIENISSERVNNVSFKDSLPHGVRFINNTLSINEKIVRCLCPMEDIYIGYLDSKEIVIIKYKAVVYHLCCLQTLGNPCVVFYDYIYNVEEPPIKVSTKSNKVMTEMRDNLFKQIIVDNKVQFPNSLRIRNGFKGIDVCAKVIEVKILKCITNADRYSVILIGVLTYRIAYIYQCKLREIIDVKGFSTILSVPNGVKYFKKVGAKADVEDTSYIFTSDDKILISTSIIIRLNG